jgi:serine/threonine-protein kinase
MTDDPRVQQLLDELHDGPATPEAVCASCPELLPVVRKRWRRMCRLRADLDAVFPPDEATRPPEGTALPQVPGYEVEAVLGSGGMGIVFRARHLRLNRPVALKMALAGAQAGLHEKARFQREAEAAAGLRHPNVVQIYDVGDAGGQPYFTMELVDGGSLAQKLAGAPQPARQAAQLVATLAGAVQAAHERGIVHRDLKPANVLLAADGTPKISDFGLARWQDDEAALTQTGVPVGTPSYMAPEQGQGHRDAIGPATDVYALGAILYELLTGRPPFRAETAAATLQQVLAEDPAPPSRLNPRVPRDLETICLKCLHKEPPRRYASAAALAEDLKRYGRGEPIAARPAGRRERLARWVRRHPAAAGLLASLTVLIAATGTGGLLLYQQQLAAGARQAETDRKFRDVLERERGQLEEGWLAHDHAKLAEARAAGIRATDLARSGGASAAVQQEAEAFREAADLRLGRAQKNSALLEAVQDVSAPQEISAYTHDEAGRATLLAQPSVDEQYAAAFRRWGLDLDSAAEAEVVARLGAEPPVVVQELIAALDGWMMERLRRKRPEAEWRRLFRVAEQLDRSDRHRRLRLVLAGVSPPRAETVAGMVGVRSLWPALWDLEYGNPWRHLLEVRKAIDPRKEPALSVVMLSRALASVEDVAGAEEVLRQAATARPDQVVLLHALGRLLDERWPSRLEEAIGYYRAARVKRPRLGIALSKALARAGRATQGEQVLQELALQQPDNPAIYYYLGVNLLGQQKHAAAEAACRRAIDRKPDLAVAHCNLGHALLGQGRHGEAEAACRKAIDLKPDLAEAYNNLGNALRGQGRHGEAEAAYRKAVDLKPDLAEPYYNLGNALRGQGRHGEAEAACRKAIDRKPDFSQAYNNLGLALQEQGRHGEAEATFRKAIDRQPDYAEAYNNLGNALNDLRKHGEAEAACRKAIDRKPNLAQAYNNLGIALFGQQRFAEAEAACRRAIDRKPDLAVAHCNLGNALQKQGKHGEAEAAFRKAIDLQPDYAECCYSLGNALTGQGKHGAAEAAYRKAIDLKPEFAEAYNNLGLALGLQKKHAEAEVVFRKAIDLKPDLANAHVNLGTALFGLGKPGEAEAAFRKAIGLKPAFGLAHHYLGIALMQQAQFHEAAAALKKGADLFTARDPRREGARQLQQRCQRYAALDARLPAILQGIKKPGNATEQIELAQLCRLKELYAAAARFYAAAFAAEPKIAQDVPNAFRYNAACAAALAGCALGKDAEKPDGKDRARLRRQALDWLREDLAWWAKKIENGTAQARLAARQRLQHTQSDPDLAGLRDKEALAKRSAQEQKAFAQLWADVAELLKKAEAKTK